MGAVHHIVGGGESAADYTHELSKVAAKTYISLRKGVAVLKRWGLGDLAGDYDSIRTKVWLPREFLHDLNVSCRHKDQYSAFKTFYTLIGLPKYLSKINYALLGRGREEKDLLLHLRNIQINLFIYLEVNYY